MWVTSYHTLGQAACELVVGQVQAFETRKVRQLWRYLAAQLIVGEMQFLQVGKFAKFRRNRTAQAVLRKVQPRQVGRGCQDVAGISPVNSLLERLRPSKRVRLPSVAGITSLNWLYLRDSALVKVGKIAHFGRQRYRSTQLVLLPGKVQ